MKLLALIETGHGRIYFIIYYLPFVSVELLAQIILRENKTLKNRFYVEPKKDYPHVIEVLFQSRI